jgi:ABC-type multidrug transport system fused ATPase/permease subunit
MNHSNHWRFIANNIVSLTTVFAGLLTVIFMTLDYLSPKVTAGVTLTLLTLLATSELVENRIRLSRIDEKVGLIPEQVSGVSVRILANIDEVMDYLIERTENARIQIDQASIDARRTRNPQGRKKYDDARRKMIKSDKVRYRYIGRLDDERRLSFVKEFVTDAKYHKFFAAFYGNIKDDIPLLNFVIFDNEELITRYPFEHGADTTYLVIRGEKVAKLFTGYFNRLWEHAEKVDSGQAIERWKAKVNPTGQP